MSKITHSFTLLTFLVLASVATASDSSQKYIVTFPSREILRESFKRMGMDHFVEKTQIDKIAERKLIPLAVSNLLECAIYDYLEDNPVMRMMMQMSKSDILEILLQADSKALEELESRGIYRRR